MLLHEVATSVAVSLFWMALAAVVAPLIARATRQTLPEVVLLLGFGLLIGPHVLDLAQPYGNGMVRQLGLGLLFLLAGMEIDLAAMRGRQGHFAWATWGLGLLMAVGIGFWLIPEATLTHAVALALAVTSTALGTLLPIIKDKGLMNTNLGRAVMTHGAVGELGPVLAMALLLGTRAAWVSGIFMVIFAIVVVAVMVVPLRILVKIPGLSEATETEHRITAQSLLRTIMVILTGLMALAAIFDLDVVLGAFAAGIAIKRISGDHWEPVMHGVEKLAFGFFIPMFFVASGMNIEIASVVERPLLLALFVGIIIVARGLPVLLAERLFDTGAGLAEIGEKRQLALYAATGLPIIVAVTEIAVSSELLTEDFASSLVAAGALTVLIFPLLADHIPGGQRAVVAAPSSDAEAVQDESAPSERKSNSNGDLIVAKTEAEITREKARADEREARELEKEAIAKVREAQLEMEAAPDEESAKAARAKLRGYEADAFEARMWVEEALRKARGETEDKYPAE